MCYDYTEKLRQCPESINSKKAIIKIYIQRNWTKVFKMTPQFHHQFNRHDSIRDFPVYFQTILAIDSEQLTTNGVHWDI